MSTNYCIDSSQGRRHQFEGRGSMNWRWGVNTAKTLKFEKCGGVHDPSRSYGGAAPDWTIPVDRWLGAALMFDLCRSEGGGTHVVQRQTIFHSDVSIDWALACDIDVHLNTIKILYLCLPCISYTKYISVCIIVNKLIN